MSDNLHKAKTRAALQRRAFPARQKATVSRVRNTSAAFSCFGHLSGNRIPDVLIAWNEPDRRSDGKIGPKISSCIAGESEDSMTAAVTGGNRYD
jgi:hypothetical protein